MTLEIIGAGFGRTGTNSLKIALELLGYNPCYHMYEVKQNPSHVEFWNNAASGKSCKWADFFYQYKAAVDWPASAFAKQLFTEFEHSKVIATIRDPEEWYESARGTIFLGMANWEKIETPETKARMRMAKIIILDGIFSGKYKDKSHCISVYEKHLEELRKSIPQKDLLEFNVSYGWEPLCEFLNVEIPKETFPHTNTRESFFK
jgi:hypothetical protein